MWVPLVILAVCTVFVGFAFGPTGWFEHHVIERTPDIELFAEAEHATDWLSIGIGTAVGVLGLILSYFLYANPNPIPARLATGLKPLYRASYDKFGVDTVYEMLIVGPVRLLATICKFIDVYFIDGLVRLTAWVPPFVGRNILGPFQNGLIQFYAAVTALSIASLLLILLLWA